MIHGRLSSAILAKFMNVSAEVRTLFRSKNNGKIGKTTKAIVDKQRQSPQNSNRTAAMLRSLDAIIPRLQSSNLE